MYRYFKLRQYFTYKTLTKCIIFPSFAISVCSFSVEPSKAMICDKCLVQATGPRSDLAEHELMLEVTFFGFIKYT